MGARVLEGLWHRGTRNPPLLVLPPTPEDGSGMDHVVGAELAWAVSQAGHPTLRFNFSGVGASQGGRARPGEQLEDAEGALRVLEENTGVAAIAIASISSSARVLFELQALHPGLAGVCFISPRSLEAGDLARLAVPALVILGAEDKGAARAAFGGALGEISGELEVIDSADAHFTRNLPQVGKSVVRWLARLGG